MTRRKKTPKLLDLRNCNFCDSEYRPKKTWQRFCSPDCHDKYWVTKRGSSSDRFRRIEKRLDYIEKQLANAGNLSPRTTYKGDAGRSAIPCGYCEESEDR